MNTHPTTPTSTAGKTRLTREKIDELLAGDPVLREDVERRLASQITEPSGETAAAMARSLAALQELADDITIRQEAVHTACANLIELARKTLEPITTTMVDGPLERHLTEAEFELHLRALRTLSGALRPAYKAAVEQLDTKLLPIARSSTMSCLKKTAVPEMAGAYGVGRQQMYKLVRDAAAGSRQRPKVSAATQDLPALHLTRDQIQDVFNDIDKLHKRTTRLLAKNAHDIATLAKLVTLLEQTGEHITTAEAVVKHSRDMLIKLAATVLDPITYSPSQVAEGHAATVDEYDVHLRVVRIVAGILRSDYAQLSQQIDTDLQGFAINAIASAARNAAVAKVAAAYGAARQNTLRLVQARWPNFLGDLRFGHP